MLGGIKNPYSFLKINALSIAKTTVEEEIILCLKIS
jgi:hypothetical protein